jgi:hypothetical protein
LLAAKCDSEFSARRIRERRGSGYVATDAALRAIEAALSSPPSQREDRVIDLERNAFEVLKQAAAESKWMPPEYCMNDWLSDCADFLRNGSLLNEVEAMREALEVGKRFLDACFSAWASGEPSHRVKTMLDRADEFRSTLNRTDKDMEDIGNVRLSAADAPATALAPASQVEPASRLEQSRSSTDARRP